MGIPGLVDVESTTFPASTKPLTAKGLSEILWWEGGHMRPHTGDLSHNLEVGRAFRNLLGNLLAEGQPQSGIDHTIGQHVNHLMQKAYDYGVQSVTPSVN